MASLGVALVDPVLTQAGGPVLVAAEVEEALPEILEDNLPGVLVQ